MTGERLTVEQNKGLRRERTAFERTLSKKLPKVSTHVYELDWVEEFTQFERSSRFVVEGIWAVGSFARGAMTCGDLDMVMQISVVAGHHNPPRKKAAILVLGTAPHRTVFIGTPEENSSMTPFPDSALLWSPSHPDWQAAMAAIPVNEDAGRHPRLYDALPFRLDQIGGGQGAESAEYIVKGLAKNWFISEWIPLEHIPPAHRDENLRFSEKSTEDAVAYTNALSRFAGAATAKVYMHALPYLCSRTPYWSWSRMPDFKISKRVGGYEMVTGPSPVVPIYHLESLACPALAVMPHITKRGPNGLWVIRRGPAHPLEKLFSRLVFYSKCGADGEMVYQPKPVKWIGDYFEATLSSKPTKSYTTPISGEKLSEVFSLADSVTVRSTSGSIVIDRRLGWRHHTEIDIIHGFTKGMVPRKELDEILVFD